MNKDEMIKIQQIEQMAIMDCRRVPRGTKCADCSFANVYSCNSYRMATALVNAHYCKVAYDEMVIKKSEYEALLLEQKRLKEIVDRIPCGYVKIADDEIVESMKTYETGRQETAREILQYIHNKKLSKAISEKYGIELE